ncbi:MAG: hypothetical protein ACKV19_00315 [Verrucomicrobiales bacterium]
MNLRIHHLLPVLAALAAGCASTSVTDSTDQEGPVFGKRDETNVVVGTDSGEVGLGDLARVAKTIRKYKDLGASEQEIIRRVAALKFDGLVATEMQRLAPTYERQKTAARQRSQARIAAVRREASAGRKPATVAAQEVAEAEAEQTKAIAAIDAEWQSAARSAVVKSHGADFAVPVSNPEGKAVVAFASVSDSGITVSSAAHELAGSRQALASAAASGRDVTHQGRSYALLDTQVSLR